MNGLMLARFDYDSKSYNSFNSNKYNYFNKLNLRRLVGGCTFDVL